MVLGYVFFVGQVFVGQGEVLGFGGVINYGVIKCVGWYFWFVVGVYGVVYIVNFGVEVKVVFYFIFFLGGCYFFGYIGQVFFVFIVFGVQVGVVGQYIEVVEVFFY